MTELGTYHDHTHDTEQDLHDSARTTGEEYLVDPNAAIAVADDSRAGQGR
jgi:hypothetical protein